MTMNVTNFSNTLKDMYPRPGERIKQYVVDLRREHEWEVETAPRVVCYPHDDNTGAECRNVGSSVPWIFLSHDCCSVCDDAHEIALAMPAVKAWLELKAARPPVEPDRTKLSDEVQEDFARRENPMMSMVRKS